VSCGSGPLYYPEGDFTSIDVKMSILKKLWERGEKKPDGG